MICPECGFNQARGDRCQQCGAVLMDKESGTGRSSGPPPVKEPPAHKHRSHPLHDLDLTISFPGVQTEKSQTQEPAEKDRPAVKEPPPKPRPAPEKPPAAKAPAGDGKTAVRVLATTTPNIEGRRIESYLGLVSGTTLIPGVSSEEFAAKAGEESALRKARVTALERLKREAAGLGADAVIGITSSLAFGSPGLWLILTGTAVRLQKA
jgi:uncharacterized protein YbjQ (UPF0145 family)